MGVPFQTIQTADQVLNRVQANIASALNGPSSAGVIQANSKNFSLVQIPTILIINTKTIVGPSGTVVNIALPDATQNAGASFPFQKTDTSSNSVVFSSIYKNQQSQTQTVQNASTYSTSSSLASGFIVSDGNNWWVIGG